MELRRLGPDDHALFRQMRIDAIVSDGRTLIATEDEERAVSDETILSCLKDWYVIAAFSGRECLGMASLVPEKGSMRNHVAEAMWVFVYPLHRKEGVAKALMDEVERLATALGIHCLELHVVADNFRAIELYMRRGYEIFGLLPKAVRKGEGFASAYYMAKVR